MRLEAPVTGVTPHVESVPDPLALLPPLDPEEPEEPEDADPLDPLAGGMQTSVPEDAEESVDAELCEPLGVAGGEEGLTAVDDPG